MTTTVSPEANPTSEGAPILDTFHPAVRTWFERRFGAPTDAQLEGWPSILEERDTLLAAPTGSGKTLAAFLVGIDRLIRDAEAGALPDGTAIVYISPLRRSGTTSSATSRSRSRRSGRWRRSWAMSCRRSRPGCAPATRRSLSARRWCAVHRTS